MNDTELRALIERMAAQLAGQAPTPQVKAADYKPLDKTPQEAAGAEAAPPQAGAMGPAPPESGAGEALPDLTEISLRQQYLVESPKNPDAFLALKAKTPARVGVGRAGPRYKTITQLRMRADHAAARDSVFSLVDESFVQAQGYTPVQTLCQSKDEYLKRPDRGRRFDEETQRLLRQTLGDAPKVVLAVGDGLSSAAIEANAADCVAAIRAGLQTWGLEAGPTLFIKFCRVGVSDHIGELTRAQVVCLLVGERPGLVTAESMSAYLTYRPHLGTPESDRTVLSNIHRQGTAAVEAGAHIAELIHTMLEKQASGVRLAQLQRGA